MGQAPTIELYQAEWCPFSHRVRLRLTELGLDFLARQVPPDRADREVLAARAGTRAIPTLVLDGEPIEGVDAILAALAARYPEPPTAAVHRRKMAADWPLWQAQHDPEQTTRSER